MPMDLLETQALLTRTQRHNLDLQELVEKLQEEISEKRELLVQAKRELKKAEPLMSISNPTVLRGLMQAEIVILLDSKDDGVQMHCIGKGKPLDLQNPRTVVEMAAATMIQALKEIAETVQESHPGPGAPGKKIDLAKVLKLRLEPEPPNSA